MVHYIADPSPESNRLTCFHSVPGKEVQDRSLGKRKQTKCPTRKHQVHITLEIEAFLTTLLCMLHESAVRSIQVQVCSTGLYTIHEDYAPHGELQIVVKHGSSRLSCSWARGSLYRCPQLCCDSSTSPSLHTARQASRTRLHTHRVHIFVSLCASVRCCVHLAAG
jgi:hypothetical protein